MTELIHCLVFFYLIIPQPQKSTLFPYTTLFRSTIVRAQTNAAAAAKNGLQRAATHSNRGKTAAMADRKSTRLNSSHVRISYAVFCLKKKKRKIIMNSSLIMT